MNLFTGMQTIRGEDGDESAEVPLADLRCHNHDCELYLLRLEADEVAPTAGVQPDRCAACGQQLGHYSDESG